MHTDPVNWTVELYPPWSEAGPVRKAIQQQPRKNRARIMRRLESLEEFGPHRLGSGHVKKVKRSREGVLELRILGVSSFRLFFVCIGHIIVVVHAFRKQGPGFTGDDVKAADSRAGKAKEWYKEQSLR